MPWGNNPVGDPTDAVRSLVGDVDATNSLLLDTQYAAWLVETGNTVRQAAILAAESLVAKYAQKPTKRVGPLMIDFGQKAQRFRDLVVELRRDPASTPIVAAIAGGITDPNTGNDIVPWFSRTTP